jgi:hypothetical protein
MGQFDDAKTQRYINGAMAEFARYAPIENQLNMAWSNLYQKRETEDPGGDNSELAAAEHYMYARWQVCSGKTWADVMRIWAMGYDAVKLAGYIPLVYVIRRAVGHTWSSPSTDSIRWGLRGAHDGERDTHAITKDRY